MDEGRPRSGGDEFETLERRIRDVLAQSAEDPDTIGPYRVVERLGRGGMGDVFLARDEALERDVAIKLIRRDLVLAPEALDRFVVEARAVARLDHANIGPVYGVEASDFGPFLVMKRIEGMTLADRIDRDGAPGRREQIVERSAQFAKLARALAVAHGEGLIHRDVKPSNIMITPGGEPVLLDFGVARELDRESAAGLTATGARPGTLQYMAPEQLDGALGVVGPGTDVYALGVSLYECLTGRRPHDAETEHDLAQAILKDEPRDARSLNPIVPRDLAAVVARATAKRPDRRYRDATLFADELERWSRGEPVLARLPSAGERVARWVQRHPLPAGFFGVLVGAVITVSLLLARATTAEAAANANLARFDVLRNVDRLGALEARVDELVPAWPHRRDALEGWLEEVGTLANLREEAFAVRDRARASGAGSNAHPAHEELERLRGRRAALSAADRVRAGGEVRSEEVPEWGEREWFAFVEMRAAPLVHPDRVVFGREALGLALARSSFERSNGADAFCARTLAFASFAVGLDADARGWMDKARAWAKQEREIADVARDVELLGRRMAELDADRRALDARILELETAVTERLEFEFDDELDAFMNDVLFDYERRRELLLDADDPEGPIATVRRRLRWARRVEHASISAHRDRWDRARAALANPDGETTHARYRAVPIDLTPQTGLVPIGPNPVTKLWEFYHLRSAWDAETWIDGGVTDPDALVVPEHGPDGRIDVGEHTGIVFVLVPGGSAYLGAQRVDERLPRWDPNAIGHESPTQSVDLAPFFLARHELTQGQWLRLSDGARPSAYQPSEEYGVTLANPVESVSWEAATALLRDHALDLPTEAQWEYAARAGTDWPWWSGAEWRSLAGAENLLDEAARAQNVPWSGFDRMAGYRDGFVVHAPVGALAPNPWGFHSMLGNVEEWCRDRYGVYALPTFGPDAERMRLDGTFRIVRGASYQEDFERARASVRDPAQQDSTSQARGFRAARPLLPR